MRIRLYGKLADAIGQQIDLDAPEGCSVGEVRQRLQADYPEAAPGFATSRAVVADELVEDSRSTAGFETIEFLPLVSGG